MADLMLIGDQLGCICLISAAMPAMCGVDQLVPAKDCWWMMDNKKDQGQCQPAHDMRGTHTAATKRTWAWALKEFC